MKKIYGIGVGPGDSELITLKGLNIIKRSSVIFIPRTQNESIALNIIKDYVKDKRIEYIDFVMGEDNFKRYEKASFIISSALKDNEEGAYVTIGDPMTYSTYIYLLKELKKLKVEVETIPGITSYNASFAALNIPAVLKGERMILCDGDIDDKILKLVDSICILKVNRKKNELIKILEKNNFEYFYVKRCSCEDEVILTNKDEILKDDEYMSLIIARRK
ncbi:MAG: precorrin-2 C(20)-methyltransferase [Caloramator sp.]|nr:precorrin-2 C(20)-methyltransferase [Caloramator sp.]